ncbi:protein OVEREXPRESSOR OF CATIONIC PEROXIDASE 3 [Lathyrus oleraceus]|uniref:protein OVEREXPRESSOR OF CATIONIC PEROXIDASE 3 n=1 Tax=Pisum sativum TaxID=3888 RepID=UPI0021D22C40|nr:protein OVEREXPRESSOR OF CATIONIC PEROXIDASE 3-like [Pisum sativum]
MLFKQLEEDLKNDDLSMDDIGDEISKEDMALLERELEGALDDFDGELLNSDTVETPAVNEAEKISKDGNDGPLNLRTWQLNKLARALKTGRRKTECKSLILIYCLFRVLK